MTTKSITSGITDGQRKQYKRFVEDAAELALTHAGVDKEGLQRLIESGGEFQKGMIGLITQFSALDQFADEEVVSTYGYGKGFKGPNSLDEQAKVLRRHFPSLGSFDKSLATKPAPSFMEGYFAIPHWSLIADTYGEAVESVMRQIVSTRKFRNYCKGEIGPSQLRETARKANMLQKLRDEQKGHDILVVAGQFGLRQAGRSFRRARFVMKGNEFGFGAYEVGIMLLTHPKRLAVHGELSIVCAGDEYAPKADAVSLKALNWSFHLGMLVLRSNDAGLNKDYSKREYGYYGSASGSLPE